MQNQSLSTGPARILFQTNCLILKFLFKITRLAWQIAIIYLMYLKEFPQQRKKTITSYRSTQLFILEIGETETSAQGFKAANFVPLGGFGTP